MVIVRLKGGIGNQLFQFAFGRAIAERRKEELFFDLTYLTVNPLNFVPRDFKLKLLTNYRIADHSVLEDFGTLYEIGNAAFISDEFPKRSISRILNDLKIKAVLLDGYYQDEFYQMECGDLIKNELKDFLNFYFNADIAKLLIYKGQETVGIHLRRGDYLTPAALEVHGICEANYYQNAMEIIKTQLDDPHFYIFSDDSMQAEEMFSSLIGEKTNVSGIINQLPSPDNDLIELALMSQCKHFILANSSYSWWGSYLSDYPDKMVIAPKNWYRNEQMSKLSDNISLESWIRI